MPDWQARCEVLTKENDDLRDRIMTLEDTLGMTFNSPAFLGLTGAEARVFGLLMARDAVTKQGAMDSLYGLLPDGDSASEKIVDVFVCKLRAKLKPFDVSIETNWGQGWFMKPSEKDKVRALINTQAEAS